MKVAVVFVLLFATVLCRPARKVSVSSSDSSEEVVRRPPAPAVRKQAVVAPKSRAKPQQNVVAAPDAESDESAETSEEFVQEAAADKTEAKFKAVTVDTDPAVDSTPVNTKGSEDDDDDDDDEEEESEAEEDESTDSSDSESGESSTPTPGTVSPAIVTEEPAPETTVDTILPTIITDTDAGRGDSLGGYPSDYKSIVYVEEKSYHKMSGPYKPYEFGTGKKTAQDITDGNEVEKSPKVYKVQAFQIHSDVLEEDTSTPEVESQGLDSSSGTSQDQDIGPRQASLPEEESASESTTADSDSSSTPEEEESASAESDDEESQSSEEATATPGAADDSDESDESDSDEEGAGPDTSTDMPAVITAK